jgi:hypothetical protein
LGGRARVFWNQDIVTGCCIDAEVGGQEHEKVGEGGMVVGELVVKGRRGNLRRPMKRFGKKARTKMAMKKRVEFMEDG